MQRRYSLGKLGREPYDLRIHSQMGAKRRANFQQSHRLDLPYFGDTHVSLVDP
jgi:hypothetical protein